MSGITCRLRQALVWGTILVGVVVGGSLMLLAIVDFIDAGDLYASRAARVRWALDRGDHLHYGLHLIAGRVLDVCPCTRDAAEDQYGRAAFHAETLRQRAAVTNVRPDSPSEWLNYVSAPLLVAADWVRDGVSWLTGARPPSVAEIAVRQRGCVPVIVHVARGATVVWRNVDTQPVFLAFSESRSRVRRLEPGAELSAIFPVPGRTEYACSAEPDSLDTASTPGVVIVS